jgi:7-hydroxymethyl chlorophyll a reductase
MSQGELMRDAACLSLRSESCSRCGLCDSYFVSKVAEACAFLGDGMSRVEDMEERVHGRRRDDSSSDQLYFGVHEALLACQVLPPVSGAQWGGLVTTIACEMLESGEADAVLCVGAEQQDRFSPRPVLARTPAQVVACRGVKPVLAPLLELLPLVDGTDVKRLVVCGVGCQVCVCARARMCLRVCARVGGRWRC